MAKFKLEWYEVVLHHYEKEVEAENAEKAKEIFYNGITGDKKEVRQTYIKSSFQGLDEIKDEDEKE